MKNLLLLALCAFCLSACAPKWEKPGATDLDLDAAKKACTEAATAEFPPYLRLQETHEVYLTPEYTTCSGSGPTLHCRSTGGRFVPQPATVVDDNQNDRNAAIRACLKRQGWQPVKQ